MVEALFSISETVRYFAKWWKIYLDNSVSEPPTEATLQGLGFLCCKQLLKKWEALTFVWNTASGALKALCAAGVNYRGEVAVHRKGGIPSPHLLKMACWDMLSP